MILLYILAAIGFCVATCAAIAGLYLIALFVTAAWPGRTGYTGWKRHK